MTDADSKDSQRIRSMFDEVASRYDRLNRLLSLGLDRYWRDRMIEGLETDRLLDLACGSGDVLVQTGEKAPTKVGLDFSRPMLERTEEKLGDAAVQGSVSLVQGDALTLPLSGGVFGAVTCAFGVRNFENRPRTFREVNRVLEPEGQFLILEFFPPGEQWYNRPVRWYLGTVLPWLGRLISQSDNAYDYLNRSIQTFVDAEQLTDELQSAGFIVETVESIFFGLVKVIRARSTS